MLNLSKEQRKRIIQSVRETAKQIDKERIEDIRRMFVEDKEYLERQRRLEEEG